MLNPVRISVILGSIVLGLGAYIIFIDIPQTRQIERQVTRDKQILPFDDRAVTRLTWVSKRETIELTRDDRFRWSIVHPISSPADNQEIRRLLRALTIGKIKRTIEGEDGTPLNLSTYGLDPPYLTLTLATPSESVAFALGDPGPFAPSLYVQTKSDNQVVLTTLDVMSFAQKTLTDFRLKDLLLFDRERVQEIRIQNKHGEMVLQRVAGVHSLTPNWMFLNPTPRPADKTTITTLLMELSALRATGFVDLEPEKHAIRQQRAKSHAGITLTEGSLLHHLDIFQFDDPEKAVAVKTPKDPLFEIPANILGLLGRDPFYFQDKRLFGLEAADIAMLSVQTPKEHYVLIHQHDEWILEDNPSISLDQNVLNLFISRVADLPAEISLPGTDDGKTRIQAPTVIIRGVNRQGQEQGKLVLGKREKGLVFAEGAALKGLYQVRSAFLDQLPSKTSLGQER